MPNIPARASASNRQSEPGISETLVTEITEHIRDRHSTISDDDTLILGLEIIRTYFYMDCPHPPYVNIEGTKNAGKSTLARIIRDLSYMSEIMFPTVAALSVFRNPENMKHTAIIDEIQRLMNARNTDRDSLHALFDLGYDPGNNWKVSALGRPGETENRDPFFPKFTLGTERNIFDDRTADRMIRITVKTGTITDQYERAYRQKMRPVEITVANLRTCLVTLAANKALHRKIKKLTANQSPIEISDNLILGNRESDVWRSLIIFADLTSKEYGKRIRAIVAERETSEPEYVPTLAEQIDSAFRKMMRDRKLSISSWLGSDKAPLPPGNWLITNENLGWPRPRGPVRDRLPEGSLIFDPRIKSAEIRFRASEFTEVCSGIGYKPKDVKDAYKFANRLHAQIGRTSMPLSYYQGQKEISIVAIDVSRWFWPDAPQGSAMKKWTQRALAQDNENPWEE